MPEVPSVARKDNAKRGGSMARAERRYRAVLLTCCDAGHRQWTAADDCGQKRAKATRLPVKAIISERVDRWAK